MRRYGAGSGKAPFFQSSVHATDRTFCSQSVQSVFLSGHGSSAPAHQYSGGRLITSEIAMVELPGASDRHARSRYG